MIDRTPRPEELPGGIVFAEFHGEAELIGGRHWQNATPEERDRIATDAAVTARVALVQARSLGYESIAEYLAATADRDPTSITRKPKVARPVDPDAATRLKVIAWPDLMAEPNVPAEMLRPGIPKVGVTVLAAPPKAGKTLWAGQTALESGVSTLMVVEEGSLAALSYRLRTQAAALGVVDPPIRLMHRQRIRLDDPACVAELRDEVDWVGDQFVIIDPLNRAHSADENRPTEMTRVMDGLAELAYRLNIAVLAIHHLAKPSGERRGDPWDRFRGASSIRSGTDANLILDGLGDRLHLIGEFRDAEPLSEWLELDRESLIFRPADAPEAPVKVDPVGLRTFVEARGQVSGRQVVDEFKVSRNTAFAALRALGCDEYAGPRGVLTFSLGTGQ